MLKILYLSKKMKKIWKHFFGGEVWKIIKYIFVFKS